MDANVPKIRPRDEELARIQDNLANTLQGVLDAAGNPVSPQQLELSPVMGQPRGPGTPKQISKLALKIHGDTSQIFKSRNYTVEIGDVATDTRPQQDVQLGFWGRVILWGQKLAQDPFVIVPGLAGIVFRTTDVNAATKVTIDDQGNLATTGSVSAASVTSANGFKAIVPMGTFSVTNSNATSNMLTYAYNVNTGTAAPTTRQWAAVRSGSVTGLSLFASQGVPATGVYRLYQNDVLVASMTHFANTQTTTFVAPKGSIAFGPGTVFRATGVYTSAVSVVSQLDMEVELGA